MTTPDKWSGEEIRNLPFGITLNLKPYACFKMFAVFAWDKNGCQTMYDGPSEKRARKIFER